MCRRSLHVLFLVGLVAGTGWGCTSSTRNQRQVSGEIEGGANRGEVLQVVRRAVFVHQASGLRFPRVLGGLLFRSVQNYERRMRGMGVSVRYRATGMHADVYVYNYRMRTIPDGVQSRQVRFAFQRAKREIGIAVQRGYYRRFTRILSGSVRLGKAPDSPRALLYIFGFVGRGGRFISVLAVTGHNQHFLKLRLTYPGRLHRTVGKVMMRRVLRQMGEMIKSAR